MGEMTVPTDRELLIQLIQSIKQWGDANLPIEHRVQILNSTLQDIYNRNRQKEIDAGNEMLIKWIGKSKGEA